MFKKEFNIQIIPLIIILIISLYYIDYKFKNDIAEKFDSVSSQMLEISTDKVKEKQDALSLIAIAVSNTSLIKESIKNNDKNLLFLKNIVRDLEKFSQYESVWIHIIDKNGKSFYRTWEASSGDDIMKFRPDVREFFKNPKLTTSISIGKFDMTYKMLAPIFDNDILLGAFEVIAKFNSVVSSLEEIGIDCLVVGDKSYKGQIKEPFSNKFIGDYYIANKNAKADFINFVEEEGIEKILAEKKYTTSKNRFVVVNQQYDVNGKLVGYLILSKPLSSIDILGIKNRKIIAIFSVIFIFATMVLIVAYIAKRKEESEILATNLKLETLVQERTELLQIANSKLKEKNSEIEKFNEKLQEIVDDEIKKNIQKDSLLVQKSRMADMGEMIGAIIHQWKQPLTIISITLARISELCEQEVDEFKVSELKEVNRAIAGEIEHMNNTANDFRNFFKPETDKVVFAPCDFIDKVKQMFKGEFEKKNINILITAHKHFEVVGYKNEFMQVLLNLFNNARDVLLSKNSKGGIIECFFELDGDIGIIRIRDNGGGIPQELLPNKLFEPYVPTKGDNGTGIGLYICKNIIEHHMDGKLWVHNMEDGAEFVIELPII